MRIIVIGASAGGVQALQALAAKLPADLDAAVLVVLHLERSSPGYLPQILTRAGPLPCIHPSTGQQLRRGYVYVAPPDLHMLIDAHGHIRLSHGPKEHRTRPAIDPLFRSAALAFGSSVIGVVLTGFLDDGTAGLFAIKECGGTTIVQDPADAQAPSMPANAVQHVAVDYTVPLSDLGGLLVRLTKQPLNREHSVMPDQLKIETTMVANPHEFVREVTQIGDPSLFTCPECHGTLLKLRDEHLVRFRCHTGHAFSAQSLLEGMDENNEEAIWTAVRGFQESAMLREHLAQHAQDAGRDAEARELLQKAEEALTRAKALRSVASNETGQQLGFDETS
jgi:two-component system, chemotaxis family, protein-glutamate methylesterase/glutaminase